MLQKCLVGRLIQPKTLFPKPNFLPLIKLVKGTTEIGIKEDKVKKEASLTSLEVPSNGGVAGRSPVVTPLSPTPLPAPKYDWFQTNTLVNIAIYTKWRPITKDRVVVLTHEQVIRIHVYVQSTVYTVHVELQHEVLKDFQIKVGSSAGKVDVLLTKSESGKRWSSIGRTLEKNGQQRELSEIETEYVRCLLVEKKQVTHDSKLFVIQLPENVFLPVPVGLHLYLKLLDSDIVKPYTPVTSDISLKEDENEGKLLYFFVKIYCDGSFTTSFDSLEIGAEIDVSLPEGSFNIDDIGPATNLALLGAGTGITPLIKLIIKSLPDKKKVHLILFNKTEDDIPWKDQLEMLESSFPDFFQLTHVLSKANDDWSGLRGRVRKDLLEELLLQCDGESFLFSCFCGPTPFTKLCIQLFKELGYAGDHYHAFLG